MKLATVLPLMIKAAEKLDLVIKKVEHEYAYYNVSVLVGDGSLNTLPRGTFSASALFDYLWDLVSEEVRQECLATDNKIAMEVPARKSKIKIKNVRKTLTLTSSPKLDIVTQLGLPTRAVFCAYAVDYKKNTFQITWNAFDNFEEILESQRINECCNWGVADKIIQL